jgi:hypothetical protein
MTGLNGEPVDIYSEEELESHRDLLTKAAKERSGPDGRR